MESLLGDSVERERFYTILLALFTVSALLIASGGVFASVNAIVAKSVRELGVRSALGAHRWRLLVLVLRRGISLTVIGGGVGIAIALAITERSRVCSTRFRRPIH